MITKQELAEKIEAASAETISIGELKYEKDIYSRTGGVDQNAIEDYSKHVLALPPVIINQDNLIIDGVHRYNAFRKAGQSEIPVQRIELDKEEIKLANLLLDLRSGVRHPEKDLKNICIERWSPVYEEKQQLWEELGISESTFYEWTKDKQREQKAKVYKSVIDDLLLVPEMKYEEIAERNAIGTATITDIKKRLHSVFPDFGKTEQTEQNELFYGICSDYHDFIDLTKSDKDILLYNIWNAPRGDNNSHFGHFPMKFAKNLLYYHTEPFDIVYDPFAGSGTMLDACASMFRKCLATDRKPPGHRTDEIFEHDIKDGLPAYLPKNTQLAFLDPPYWKQAENQYSEDGDDLGNMSLDDFNAMMGLLLKALEKSKIERIAAVIQPTQYKNDWTWTDHIFDFDKMLTKYRIEARYILPYSTQQYLPQMVEKAKENNKCLSSFRDLVVWRLK